MSKGKHGVHLKRERERQRQTERDRDRQTESVSLLKAVENSSAIKSKTEFVASVLHQLTHE